MFELNVSRAWNACPFPPGIDPPKKRASFFYRVSKKKFVRKVIPERLPFSRRAVTAIIVLTTLMFGLTFPWIKHNVITPYITPPFDGVIVYVDGSSQVGWTGSIRLLESEVQCDVKDIGGFYVAEYLIHRPGNVPDWDITVIIDSWTMEKIGVRIIDGLSGKVISEGSSDHWDSVMVTASLHSRNGTS